MAVPSDEVHDEPAAPSRDGSRRRSNRQGWLQQLGSERWAPWVLLSPLIVFTVVFFLIPLCISIYLSFTRWNPLGAPVWVGLRQFEYLLTRDPLFYPTLRNTFVFAFGLVLIGTPLSLALAFIFSRVRGRTIWRSIYYLPQVTNVVAIAYIWQFVLDDRHGLVNRALAELGVAGPNWLSDPVWAMVSVILVMIWYELGKNMIVFSAALQNVDRSLYEAATLDNARTFAQFRYITVPSIRPAILFVLITSFITGMGWFALILAMTGGGPGNATEVSALYLYEMAFADLRMGRASAAALLLFAVIAMVTVVQARFVKGFGDDS